MQLPAISATALVHPSVMRCGCGHGSAPTHTNTHRNTHTHISTSLDTHTCPTHLGNSICRSFCAVAVAAAAAAVGKQHFSAFFTYLQIFSFLVFGLLISGPGLDREREGASKSVRQMPSPMLSPQRMRGNYGDFFFLLLQFPNTLL